MRSYKDLEVWQVAMELAAACYEHTRLYPREETYGMTSQIRRASVSIAANIAEGYGREQTGSFIQFLRIAQGSTKELETHLMLALRVGLSKPEVLEPLMTRCERVSKMLRNLIRSLEAKRDALAE
ncbi:MAG: four helix bundle protein [Hyphomicrobium sp.]